MHCWRLAGTLADNKNPLRSRQRVLCLAGMSRLRLVARRRCVRRRSRRPLAWLGSRCDRSRLTHRDRRGCRFAWRGRRRCGTIEVERARFGRTRWFIARRGRVASAVTATRFVTTFTTRALVEAACAGRTRGSAGNVAFGTAFTTTTTTTATATRPAPGALAAITLGTLLLAVTDRLCD